MHNEKKENEEQVNGLKYELGDLEKNFKDLQDSSAKSLEEIEKVKFVQSQKYSIKKPNHVIFEC